MKIAHVVTLVSPDGAFGGPVRVATNLARAMQDAGHEVTILGSHRGYDLPPTQLEGVPARLFPARRLLPGLGFSGLVSPGLLAHLHRHIAEFDIVHLHLARDLVTLPSALLARRRGVPYVTQTHGMIDASRRRLAHVLDALATRTVLRQAPTLFHLTEQERDDLVQVARTSSLPLAQLPNGVPVSKLQADVESGREVLFLARLHAVKRPLAFVEAAIALKEQFPETRFTLVGPDEGEAADVMHRIESANAGGAISWEGSLAPSQTLERMSRASIYVLPSIEELFPMSVLEAMSIGLPTIVTDTCGLIPELHDPNAVVVVNSSLDGLVTELKRLLSDPTARVALGDQARREVEDRFSIYNIAAIATSAYRSVTSQAERLEL
ncbi:glycosyltransferase [Actinopolymorpha sp. NPDC004070]|uniref:glycosyltransferase n=1 Tax=Actinopolymorpha sp. NPDC004070 TaxID=3154548 RepID=UPI0033A8713E